MSQNEVTRPGLDYIFHPRSTAVVGTVPDSQNRFKLGNQFIRVLQDFGYKDPLYAVGSGVGEVSGLKVYQNIGDIPGVVDYVITAIPNREVPKLVEQCGEKGVRVMHLFVSGFGEIEDRVGLELQQEILRTAGKYGIRIIGPNCMGIYCPRSGLAFGMDFSRTAGKVGYLAQSGGQCILGIKEATRRGIYFSKVVSYGNAADINECDLLEYFTDDPDTEIITAYIEGTNHGPRLLQVLREASAKKPVIVFKCAATEGGSQAAVSHTSAIAGSSLTWETLLRQTGAIRVYSVKEMFDVVIVLQRCPEIKGLNTLVLGHGGGSCVQASDDCCRAGLKMPMLPVDLRQALMKVYKTDAGNIFKNPLDINPYWGMDKAREAFNAVAGWDGLDLVLLHSTPEQDPFVPRDFQYQIHTDTLIEWAKLSTKPVVLVMNTNTAPGDDGLPEKSFNRALEAGYAVFPSVERAATAVFRVYQHYRSKSKPGNRIV
ncbi:MAG: CoA-binding protein [Chloroflexi bacterium]|nr:CoA-binding protein [Chloroflexota bacterium]